MEYIDRKESRIQRAIREQREQKDWNEVHNQLRAIQKKSLAISDPGDADEKEADEVARKVMSGESAEIHGTGGGTIDRKGEGSAETTPEFQTKLESSKGGGQSLDGSVKNEMESKTGADFSGVKIHTGNEAHKMSESINAKAFTHGQDIYFNQNHSPANKELLAHELVHTVQQENSISRVIQRNLDTIPPGLKKDVQIVATQLPHLGDSLKHLFANGASYTADHQVKQPNGTFITDTALETVAASPTQIVFSNVPEKLKPGFRNVVRQLLNETVDVNTKEISSKLPVNSSVTVLIDFSSDTPDSTTYPEVDRPAVAAEFKTKKAYRFTRYGNAIPTSKVEVEGLGPVIKEGDANAGKTKFSSPDMNFSFIDEVVARGDIGVKLFTDQEKEKVYSIISAAPDSVLKTIKGTKFERAKISQVDFDAKKKAALQPNTPEPPATIGAEYSAATKTITVYDLGLQDGGPSIFESTEAGFSSGLLQTITQAAGEEKFLNTDINFHFNDSPATRSDSPDIGLKAFKPDEKRQIYGAIAKVDDSILKRISGMTFERAKIDQDDFNKRKAVIDSNAANHKNDPLPEPKTSASYGYNKHTLTVFDHAFETSLTIFGDTQAGFSTGFEATILHEMGHAIDKTPLRLAFSPDNPLTIAADLALGVYNENVAKRNAEVGPITDEHPEGGTYLKAFNDAKGLSDQKYKEYKTAYNAADVKYKKYYNETSKQYSFPDDAQGNADYAQFNIDQANITKLNGEYSVLLQATKDRKKELEDKTKEWDAILKIGDIDLKAKQKLEKENKEKPSESGSKTVLNVAENKWELDKENEKIKTGAAAVANAGDNAFRKAAIIDKGRAVSDYGATTWTEYYAESFSFYITDPQRMAALEPNIYAYFVGKFPRT